MTEPTREEREAREIVDGWEKVIVNSFSGDVRAMFIRDIARALAARRLTEPEIEAALRAVPWRCLAPKRRRAMSWLCQKCGIFRAVCWNCRCCARCCHRLAARG